MFGTPLTPEEKESYEDKVRVHDDADVIKGIVEQSPNDFAGLYYESETGSMVVQVVNDSEEVFKKITTNVKNRDKIKFEKQKFSKADLDNAQEKLYKSERNQLLKAIIPDIKNNKIIVVLSELNPDIKKYFEDLVGSTNVLTFAPGSSTESKFYSTSGPDEANYGDPFPYGVRITGDNGSQCTVGFFGTNQSDNTVMVTAGHCDTTTSTQAWSQPKNSLFELKEGNWSTRTSGDTTADAGYVVITGEKGKAEIPYPNSTSDPNPNRTPLNGTYTSDVVGTTIYLRGATTGKLVSGTIKYTNIDEKINQKEYTWLRKQIYSTHMGTYGDSGGSIVAEYKYVSQKGGYTFKLAGIISGAKTVQGIPGMVDGTYMRYSPIWTVNSALNLKTLNAGCPCY
ncbi:MAG: hypothetical protein ACQEXQ_15270 [Bacillota bacterium]